MVFKKTILPNGVKVLTEKMPHTHSLTLGIVILGGAREDPSSLLGISHFIEHMVFKGTKKRNIREIAQLIDWIGGEANGVTMREFTYFYVKCLKENFHKAWDLLSDLIVNPEFSPQMIELEKKVVLEEIKSFEDSPSEQTLYLLLKTIFSNSTLGRPILGEKDTVEKFSKEIVKDFHHQNYFSSNIIIGAVGEVEHDEVVELVGKMEMKAKSKEKKREEKIKYTPKNVKQKRKDVHQVYIGIGTPIPGYPHKERYHWLLLNTLFGGGVSSRLFQRLREKEALVYEVNSFLEMFSDVGIFGIYLVTDTNNVEKSLNCIWEEFDRIRKNGLEKGELERVKNQLKTGLILNLENSHNRLIRILTGEVYLQKYTPIREVMNNIENITPQSLFPLLHHYFTPQIYTISKVGKLG